VTKSGETSEHRRKTKSNDSGPLGKETGGGAINTSYRREGKGEVNLVDDAESGQKSPKKMEARFLKFEKRCLKRKGEQEVAL